MENVERLNMLYIFSRIICVGNQLHINKNKSIIVTGTFILFLILTGVFLSIFWPRYEERFFEIGLLGKDKLAKDYYLNDNYSLTLGSQVDWFIYVHNHIGSAQNVVVKVKLVNSIVDLPNDLDNVSCPFDSIAEFPLSMSVNDSLIVPFSWIIVEAISQKNSIIIKQLTVNDQIVEVNVSDFSESFFRMVFELWVYNESLQTYEFGWESEKGLSSSSINMAFRVSLETDQISGESA